MEVEVHLTQGIRKTSLDEPILPTSKYETETCGLMTQMSLASNSRYIH